MKVMSNSGILGYGEGSVTDVFVTLQRKGTPSPYFEFVNECSQDC